MASRFLQAYRKLFANPTLIRSHRFGQPKYDPFSSISRNLSTEVSYKSPFESNILRILRNEIQYQSEFAPPRQPAVQFNAYTVEDRPGEQSVILRSKFGEDERVKIEATMFDGSRPVPKYGKYETGQDVHLHISLLVDISKGNKEDGSEDLEFVCSAWPTQIEIERVYIFNRDANKPKPYIGPHFRDMDYNLQKELVEFLKVRGINNDLSVFLHDFIANKHRIELIQWLSNVKSCLDK
ncbi:uncharacterized protein At2g39795, mitochondrial [Impatiens glandulifera]|uniref:uncharacterized protein At2g39795, mitochondrial n=1 Tax=Impatiens glandulifera TaxID=253017 RepID=UPI001FB0DDAF|nr:uncharacterized protein At2g39795, mitochondrial [Impatiens glandulifera]